MNGHDAISQSDWKEKTDGVPDSGDHSTRAFFSRIPILNFFGCTDDAIERRLDRSELPDEARHLIRDVMNRIGLSRAERVDVLEELIAHFQDSVETGASDMTESFGDTKQLARLIHRAKVRNHRFGGIVTKILLWLGAVVGLFIVFYIGSLIYYHSGETIISHDYLADVTEKARNVPESERAWPIYREALVVLNRDWEELGNSFYFDYPGGETWEDTVAFLKSHEKEIDLIHQAAAMPGMGLVAGHTIAPEDRVLWPDLPVDAPADPSALMSQSMITVLIPQLGMTRKMAKMLASDVYLAMEENDPDRVLTDIRSMFGIAEHSHECPILIADLVSIAIANLAFIRVEEVIREQPDLLRDEQLRTLAHELAALTNGGDESPLAVRINMERFAMYDILQRVFTDDGNGNGHLSPQGMKAYSSLVGGFDSAGEPATWEWADLTIPAAGIVTANRQELKTEYDRLMDMTIAEAALPLWKRPEYTVEDEIEKLQTSLRWKTKYFLVGILMPALSRVSVTQEKTIMRRDAMMTAVALELYRREHNGKYPAGLEALVPEYLPTIPLDQFNGKPMGYVVLEDGNVILYGVGVDLDDDGGREADEEITVKHRVDRWLHPSEVAEYKKEDEQTGSTMAGKKLADGDWILWESREKGFEQ